MNLEEIFSLAINKKASDVHLVIDLPPVLRIDGLLERQEDLPSVSQKDLLSFVERNLNEGQKKNLFENLLQMKDPIFFSPQVPNT